MIPEKRMSLLRSFSATQIIKLVKEYIRTFVNGWVSVNASAFGAGVNGDAAYDVELSADFLQGNDAD